MNLSRYLHSDYLPLLLIAAMILTRFHHFGDALHLPDASLAVFFFAGSYRNKLLFGFLLALAGMIDYVAIANGTSAWCVSPAYAFLVPTYGIMWLGGRYYTTWLSAKVNKSTFSVWAIGFLSLATSLAFVISNGSFYLFSGRYPDLSWSQYLSRVAQYYPPYLSSTLIYAIVGYALVRLVKAVVLIQESRHTAL
jgi:hypothetical protein